MVERLNHDPRILAMSEAEVREAPPPRQGLCLFCGAWIESDQPSFGVTLTSPSEERADHVACPQCLRAAAHASARLQAEPGAPLVDPVPPPASQPDNYLAGKYRTPSGR